MARELADAGVLIASLTDHDTIQGQVRFQRALQKHSIRFISGLELEVNSPVGVIHLLGYGFDLKNACLLQTLHELQNPFVTNLRKWISNLRNIFTKKTSHSHGKCPKYIEKGQLSAGEAISLIHQAGGVVFLAHPLSGPQTMDDMDDLLTCLTALGLDGIEAFYKPYPREIQMQLCEIAHRFHLRVSAGSDFHGFYFREGNRPGHSLPKNEWSRTEKSIAREERNV